MQHIALHRKYIFFTGIYCLW